MLCSCELRAVFVRILKPEVTYEQFKEAWAPEGLKGNYPAIMRLWQRQPPHARLQIGSSSRLDIR